jgi:hypothetical protein
MKCKEAINIFESVRSEYDVPEKAKLHFIEKRYIELPVDVDPQSKAQVSDHLVWVGRYILGARFYEFACEMTGKIVRFRKSR